MVKTLRRYRFIFSKIYHHQILLFWKSSGPQFHNLPVHKKITLSCEPGPQMLPRFHKVSLKITSCGTIIAIMFMSTLTHQKQDKQIVILLYFHNFM